MRYALIARHRDVDLVRRLCRSLEVHPGGYYAWSREPLSAGARDERRLTGLVKQFWLESGGVYGYRKTHTDLRSVGEHCGPNRVHRLMLMAGLRAEVGYRRRPRAKGGVPAVIAPTRLQQQFDVRQPDAARVTDTTCIRTHEGWLYLAVVFDLFSRQAVGGRCSRGWSVTWYSGPR